MKRFLVILAFVMAVIGMMAGQARATAELELIDTTSTGTISETIIDSTGTGVVNFTGQFAGYEFNVTTGVTMPAVGSAGNPTMDLSSVNIQGTGGGGTLTLKFTDTGFSYSGGMTFAPAINLLSAYPTTVTAAAYWGSNPFDMTHQIGSTLSFSGNGGIGSVTGSVLPSTLTEVLTINPDQNGDSVFVSADATLTTPEPASLLLVGGGLGLGGLLSRFRKKKA
jgi:hypothetical protein